MEPKDKVCTLELKGTYYGIDVNEFVCSRCHGHYHLDDEWPNYCPCCGAVVIEVEC